MNLTLDTAKAIARAVDTNARNAFARAVFAHDHADYGSRAFIADAEAGAARADARRDAVQRLLRRKGFRVTVRPVGFCTIVEAP